MMPLSVYLGVADHRIMWTSADVSTSAGRGHPGGRATVLIVTEGAGSDRVVAVRPGIRDRLLTRLRGSALDGQLAAGQEPEHSCRLALRAAQLVAPGNREQLAAAWERMIVRAQSPRRPGDPTAPLARAPIAAARRQISELTAALRVARPVPAGGVAMARLLLTDGSGPLYSSRAPVALSAALAETIRRLDPAERLVPLP